MHTIPGIVSQKSFTYLMDLGVTRVCLNVVTTALPSLVLRWSF